MSKRSKLPAVDCEEEIVNLTQQQRILKERLDRLERDFHDFKSSVEKNKRTVPEISMASVPPVTNLSFGKLGNPSGRGSGSIFSAYVAGTNVMRTKVGACTVTENGIICRTKSRKVCEICHRSLCMKHRYQKIYCTNSVDSLKDCVCLKDSERHLNPPGPGDPLGESKRGKGDVGRCVRCTGGQKRKVSRTRCQNCRGHICAIHQAKTVRCAEHRDYTASQGPLNSDLDSFFLGPPLPENIDHISPP